MTTNLLLLIKEIINDTKIRSLNLILVLVSLVEHTLHISPVEHADGLFFTECFIRIYLGAEMDWHISVEVLGSISFPSYMWRDMSSHSMSLPFSYFENLKTVNHSLALNIVLFNKLIFRYVYRKADHPINILLCGFVVISTMICWADASVFHRWSSTQINLEFCWNYFVSLLWTPCPSLDLPAQ